jgi:diacylglycerol kinase (ATP)
MSLSVAHAETASDSVASSARARVALLVVNPKAGAGLSGGGLERFIGVVRKRLGDVDVALTERPGHAVSIAEQAARSGRQTVVAIGGDGSIHEVASGLMRARAAGFDGTRLGIIGRGTGGDLCRTLGLEHRLDRYLEAIAEGRPRLIDVGRAEYLDVDGSPAVDTFVNILSVGMGGLVDRYVRETARWAGGAVGYYVATLRALAENEVARLALRLELAGAVTELEIESRQIAICNGRYFGSGMHVAPMAKLDDGVFEVIDLGAPSKLTFAAASPSVYSGRHLERPYVHHHRCDRLELRVLNERARASFLLDVDGEPLGSPPLSIALLPRALPVLLPVRPS